MKKTIIALGFLILNSCATQDKNENRTPNQVTNVGSFSFSPKNLLANKCSIKLIDRQNLTALNSVNIETFSESNSGQVSTCVSSRLSKAPELFKENSDAVLDYCFKIVDADAKDLESGYAEVYLVRRDLRSQVPVAMAPMTYLNQNNPLIIKGQNSNKEAVNVQVNDRYILSGQCAVQM